MHLIMHWFIFNLGKKTYNIMTLFDKMLFEIRQMRTHLIKLSINSAAM